MGVFDEDEQMAVVERKTRSLPSSRAQPRVLFLSGQIIPFFQREKFRTYEKAIRHARTDSYWIRWKCRTANDGKRPDDPTRMKDVDKLRASRKDIFVESRFVVVLDIFVEVISPACGDSFLAVLSARLRCLRVRSARDARPYPSFCSFVCFFCNLCLAQVGAGARSASHMEEEGRPLFVILTYLARERSQGRIIDCKNLRLCVLIGRDRTPAIAVLCDLIAPLDH